jgi:orotate phosphoribosyltransferase
VTTGGSVVTAIERIRSEDLEIARVLCVVDRLAGGGKAIEAVAEAPFEALFTIDDVYPGRPDR